MGGGMSESAFEAEKSRIASERIETQQTYASGPTKQMLEEKYETDMRGLASKTPEMRALNQFDLAQNPNMGNNNPDRQQTGWRYDERPTRTWIGGEEDETGGGGYNPQARWDATQAKGGGLQAAADAAGQKIRDDFGGMEGYFESIYGKPEMQVRAEEKAAGEYDAIWGKGRSMSRYRPALGGKNLAGQGSEFGTGIGVDDEEESWMGA